MQRMRSEKVVLRYSVWIVDPLHTVGPRLTQRGWTWAHHQMRCLVRGDGRAAVWGTPHALRRDRNRHSRRPNKTRGSVLVSAFPEPAGR